MNTQSIQALLAPVVMISACGLLCVAMYNRLTAIVSRIRQFNRERIDDLLKARGSSDTVRRTIESHREGLETQVPQLLARARLIHRSLMCFMIAIACMLLCSLTIGLSMLVPQVQAAAFGLFVLGILIMFIGVVTELFELRRSLAQVEFEHELTEKIGRKDAPEAMMAAEE